MYKLLILICFVVGTHAQRWFWGKCPDVTVQEDFNVTQYLGVWYERERYFASFQMFASCGTANYTFDGSSMIVNNTAHYPLLGYRTALASAQPLDPLTPAKLTINYPKLRSRFEGKYWVISTDYDTYAIVWSCKQRFFFNTQLAWILTRDRSILTSEEDAQISSILAANGIRRNAFSKTSQRDCELKL